MHVEGQVNATRRISAFMCLACDHVCSPISVLESERDGFVNKMSPREIRDIKKTDGGTCRDLALVGYRKGGKAGRVCLT